MTQMSPKRYFLAFEDGIWHLRKREHRDWAVPPISEAAETIPAMRLLVAEVGIDPLTVEWPQDYPVLYELDEDNQSTGYVMRFCSDACAETFRLRGVAERTAPFERATWGREDYCNTEEVCCECGRLLDLTEISSTPAVKAL